jgi:hypothetical protein
MRGKNRKASTAKAGPDVNFDLDSLGKREIRGGQGLRRTDPHVLYE